MKIINLYIRLATNHTHMNMYVFYLSARHINSILVRICSGFALRGNMFMIWIAREDSSHTCTYLSKVCDTKTTNIYRWSYRCSAVSALVLTRLYVRMSSNLVLFSINFCFVPFQYIWSLCLYIWGYFNTCIWFCDRIFGFFNTFPVSRRCFFSTFGSRVLYNITIFSAFSKYWC